MAYILDTILPGNLSIFDPPMKLENHSRIKQWISELHTGVEFIQMNQCIEWIDSNGWNEVTQKKIKSLFLTYWCIDVISNTQTDGLSGANKHAD